METRYVEEKLKELNKNYYRDTDIIDIFKEYDKNFNSDYKNIFIKKLCDDGCLYSYDNNKYKLYKKKIKYIPIHDIETEMQLKKIIKDKKIEIVLFDTSFVNDLSELQMLNTYKYLGVESFAINYIVDAISKHKLSSITSSSFYKLRKYYSDLNFDFDYIIRNIGVDTPLLRDKDSLVCYPKLETILVDLFADKFLFSNYCSEIEHIYSNAFSSYAIKINTLFRYANKKGVISKVKELLDYINFDVETGEFK